MFILQCSLVGFAEKCLCCGSTVVGARGLQWQDQRRRQFLRCIFGLDEIDAYTFISPFWSLPNVSFVQRCCIRLRTLDLTAMRLVSERLNLHDDRFDGLFNEKSNVISTSKSSLTSPKITVIIVIVETNGPLRAIMGTVYSFLYICVFVKKHVSSLRQQERHAT